MRSRAAAVVAFATVLLLAGCVEQARSQHPHDPAIGPAKSASSATTLTVAPRDHGAEFPRGAVGLSTETDELGMRTLSATRRSLVTLMQDIGPGILRIGGNSVDYSWWTSDHEPQPTWATNVVTPSDLAALRRLLDATGWKVILGVDLGHFDPARAADEATNARRILGPSLLGFEIGNEPDAYGLPRIRLRSSSYGLSDYLQQLSTYAAAIKASDASARLYGPDASLETWLNVTAYEKGHLLSAITQHYYPTRYSVSKGSCVGTPVPPATELFSSRVRDEENTTLRTLSHAGAIAGTQIQISETNTTASCDTDGGPKTSPVFASALWSLDWILRAASAGVVALEFHGRFGPCAPNTVSPICSSPNESRAHREVIARPEYYGLLAAHELEGGRFVPVDITGHPVPAQLTAYATTHPSGAVTLAVENVSSHSILARVTAGRLHMASYESLAAPSLESTTGITFGHVSVNAKTGRDRLIASHVRAKRGFFVIPIGSMSAVVVTMRH
jgi:hypothetical protein